MNTSGGIAKWLRQRSAKPLFTGSNPVAASNNFKGLVSTANSFFHDGSHLLSGFTHPERDFKNTVFSTQKYSLHPIALCGWMVFKLCWCMIMHLRMWFPLSPEPAIKAETQRAITPPFPPWVPRHITQGGLHWCPLKSLSLIKGSESATLIITERHMGVFPEGVCYLENRETFL